MRNILYAIIILMCSCGGGNTGEGYTADTTALNPDAGTNAQIPAGDRMIKHVDDSETHEQVQDSINHPNK